MRTIIFVTFAACLLNLKTGSAQDQDFVRISPAESFSPNEISVGISPVNPNILVAVAMRRGFQSGVSNHAFYSADGGKTWNVSNAPNKQNRTQGDDVVGFLSDGTVVRSYISFRGLWDKEPQNPANGIFFSRSIDGGASWSQAVAVVDHVNSKTPFEDKPWFVVDSSEGSPNMDSVYVTWTRFDNYGSKSPADKSHIYFSRSSDRAKSFSPPVRISDQGGDCLDDDGTLEGAVPATGPKGQLYVVWAGPRGLEFDFSNDAGRSWNKDRVISSMPGGWNSEVSGVARHNGMPVTQVDLSESPMRGTIYVNWIDERNKDKDVFLINSRDEGKTWSTPIRVNSDPLGNGKDQFFTSMSVDPADGSINIIYYDRAGLDKESTGVTLSRSENGGQSFRHFKIDVPPFQCQKKAFMGDYIGVKALNRKVFAAFPHFDDDKKLVLSGAIFDF